MQGCQHSPQNYYDCTQGEVICKATSILVAVMHLRPLFFVAHRLHRIHIINEAFQDVRVRAKTSAPQATPGMCGGPNSQSPVRHLLVRACLPLDCHLLSCIDCCSHMAKVQIDEPFEHKRSRFQSLCWTRTLKLANTSLQLSYSDFSHLCEQHLIF